MLIEEVRRKDRLVAIDDEAALICPWASRGPFELRVIPRREVGELRGRRRSARAMIATAMRLLAKRFGAPPELNLWVRTAPRGTEQFHWHVDIAPRLTIKAGFELGTGVDINVYPPEQAASDLRELPVDAEHRVEQSGEPGVDVVAAEATHLARPLLPLFDQARLAQHPEMVGAGRFGDRRGEAAAGRRFFARRQFGDDPAPLRIAQRVEDGGDVELVAVGVFEAHGAHDTTFVVLCGTVIIEL